MTPALSLNAKVNAVDYDQKQVWFLPLSHSLLLHEFLLLSNTIIVDHWRCFDFFPSYKNRIPFFRWKNFRWDWSGLSWMAKHALMSPTNAGLFNELYRVFQRSYLESTDWLRCWARTTVALLGGAGWRSVHLRIALTTDELVAVVPLLKARGRSTGWHRRRWRRRRRLFDWPLGRPQKKKPRRPTPLHLPVHV